ncbi:MAG: replication factor C large subunit [Nanoarchaeota archaeon]|nr:replication factor C large subunit [Nanoarchaeota archaeon]
MMASFVEKYSPKRISEIVNQKSAVAKVIQLLNNRRKKGIIVYGPPGVGKTCSIHAIANELNYEIIEISSQIIRNKDAVENIVGNAIKMGSLFNKKKLILVDEIESMSAKDRGGIQAIVNLIKKTNVPIIIIALDLWNEKLRALRSYCEHVEFKKLTSSSIKKRLEYILKNEEIKYEDGVLEVIAKNADGDLRAAINDLEVVCAGKKEIKVSDIVIEQRNPQYDVFKTLQKVFQAESVSEALETIESSNLDIQLLILWFAENIARTFKDKLKIAQAYEFLSKADLFYGRITKRQHWGFYRYSIIFTSFLSTVGKTHRFVRYAPPSIFTYLYRTKAKREMLKSIGNKLSEKFHTSTQIVLEDYIQLLRILAQKNKKTLSELGLSKEEIAFLSK